jgi:hypothetical protein
MLDVHAQWSCAAGSGLIIAMEFRGLMKRILYNILGCNGFETSILLGYDYMLIGVLFPTFKGCLLPPFSAIQEALE